MENPSINRLAKFYQKWMVEITTERFTVLGPTTVQIGLGRGSLSAKTRASSPQCHAQNVELKRPASCDFGVSCLFSALPNAKCVCPRLYNCFHVFWFDIVFLFIAQLLRFMFGVSCQCHVCMPQSKNVF